MSATIRNRFTLICLCAIAYGVVALTAKCQDVLQSANKASSGATIDLPAPQLKGSRSLEEVLAARHSVREFTDKALTEAELSQLLWAAQGITHGDGNRTAPSAAALYPLEVYVATASGLYKYVPAEHELIQEQERDVRPALRGAALGQAAITKAPAVFVISAVCSRLERRFGDRAERFAQLEAGHAAQNLVLEATALDLGGVTAGAFDDERVRSALQLPEDESPLYLIPVGHPAAR